MNFEHTDITGTPVSHPREDAAEGEKTSDLDVRNTGSGDTPSTVELKGDHNIAEAKGGHTEDLLGLDPFGRKSPEQAAYATGDRGQVTNPPQHEVDPFGLATLGDRDAKILKPEESDPHAFTGLEDNVPSQFSSDSPMHASSSQMEDSSSSTPPGFSPHGNFGEEASIPVRSDAPTDPVFESFGRNVSPSPEPPLESGAVEPGNPRVDPTFDSYMNEPTPKSDASFDMPVPSAGARAAELGGGSSNPLIPDSSIQPGDPTDAARDFGKASPNEQDPPTPELVKPTPTFPKADSPILLETATKADDMSDVKSDIKSDDLAAEIPIPYINPDPFQDIPSLEKKELYDQRAARIPSPSSMDAEPPTPVDRSALNALKETKVEPADVAERVVDELPLEALRNRDVQEVLASVIPPAPDKPLPPTPGSESRPAPARRAAAGSGIGHLPVMEVLLWRDPKKSGAAFATGLVVLLSMMYFSFISVVAYFALALLTVTLGFRLYKVVMGMVQKTNDGHPFQDLLSVDTKVTAEKGHELADKVVAELNCSTSLLKDLFLVKDIFESVKFGFVLYLLTYLGAWFNTMTLVIMAYVAMFTLPKVYEQNKEKIDEVLGQVKAKVGEISTKVKAAIPMGKKTAEQPVTEEKKEE